MKPVSSGSSSAACPAMADSTTAGGGVPPSSDPLFTFGLPDAHGLLHAVRSSQFVAVNTVYSSMAGQISVYVDTGEDCFNAFATAHQGIALSNGEQIAVPAVVFNRGLFAWSRLLAAFVASSIHDAGRIGGRGVVASRLRMVGDAMCGRRPGDAEALWNLAIAGLKAQGVRADAEQLAFGVEVSVMAHEVGHLCLAHTASMQGCSDEVSRNQEREADSFAASVLSSLAGGEATFLGHVLCPLMFAWQDFSIRNRQPTSHPLGRERFQSALRSRSEHLAAVSHRYGLGEAELLALLPSVH